MIPYILCRISNFQSIIAQGLSGVLDSNFQNEIILYAMHFNTSRGLGTGVKEWLKNKRDVIFQYQVRASLNYYLRPPKRR